MQEICSSRCPRLGLPRGWPWIFPEHMEGHTYSGAKQEASTSSALQLGVSFNSCRNISCCLLAGKIHCRACGLPEIKHGRTTESENAIAEPWPSTHPILSFSHIRSLPSQVLRIYLVTCNSLLENSRSSLAARLPTSHVNCWSSSSHECGHPRGMTSRPLLVPQSRTWLSHTLHGTSQSS